MMRKKSWLVGMMAVALIMATASCSKDSGSSTSEQSFVENFKALVMGGNEVDSLQNWSTVEGMPVTISVDYGDAAAYTVYILSAPALFDTDAAYLGMARVTSGSQKTITLTCPPNTTRLWASCYDADGHAVCQPFTASAAGTTVVFNGRRPSTDGTATSGNAWSVAVPEMPDLSTYTDGPASRVSEATIYDDNQHLIVSQDYTGRIPALEAGVNSVVIVTATWTLSNDQSISNDNVVVVSGGGRIVIPKGTTLSVGPNGVMGPGQLYVMAGGNIEGDGTLSYIGGGPYYQAGIVNLPDILLEGATLYQSGNIGSSDDISTTLTCTTDDDGVIGTFINTGQAYLAKFDSERLSLQNGGYLKVADALTLTASSRLDDNSYTECTALRLNGSSDGSCTLLMGNAATLNISGDLTVDNFGVWGPSGSNFFANAILKTAGCSACTTTSGVAGTCLLDHVELVLPATFPVTEDTSAATAGNRLVYHWMNGYEGRQTCTYGTSPSFSTLYVTKGSNDAPVANGVYYAFETMEGTFRDFDYNDIVLRVSVPVDRGDGTYVSNIQVMCVGNSLKTTLLYRGEPFGEELHATIGVLESRSANNTTPITRVFAKVGELTFTDGNSTIDQLPFTLQTEDSNGNIRILETGEAPLYIVVNGDSHRQWFWPSEGSNIGVAYPLFTTWASNRLTALDWYSLSNAVSSRTVQWTADDE